MRKLVMILIGCCFLLGCSESEKSSSVWLYGDNDSLGVRVGTEVAENVEAGLSALWWPDNEAPEIYGAYAVYHLQKLDFLPETISGKPYLGAKVDLNMGTNKERASFIGGITFEDILFVEFQADSIDRKNTNESKVIFGLRIRF